MGGWVAEPWPRPNPTPTPWGHQAMAWPPQLALRLPLRIAHLQNLSRLPLRPLLRMAHMQTLPSLPLILLFRVTYLMNHHPYANTPMTHPSPLSHEPVREKVHWEEGAVEVGCFSALPNLPARKSGTQSLLLTNPPPPPLSRMHLMCIARSPYYQCA